MELVKKRTFFLTSYTWFLFAAIGMLIFSFFPLPLVLNLRFRDSFVVISPAVKIRIIAAVLFCFWLLYLLTHTVLRSRMLSTIHTAATIIIIFFLVGCVRLLPVLPPDNLTAEVFQKYRQQENTFITVYLILAIAFVITQLVYLVNLINGLWHHKRKALSP